jgi:ubiquinone/menaquinone biosynthesis C-methylase UbiE
MRQNADFFDVRAEQWEQNCYPAPTRRRLEALIPTFNVTPGARILDIGTGPGILIPYLRNIVGRQGRICAFDISFQMACQAGKKLEYSEDLVLQADVHNITFKDDIFDHVLCFAAFPHFDSPDRAVQEMARVGKPGARMVIAHLMSREELARHHATHSAVAKDALPNDDLMATLFINAGLTRPEITDIPGAYLATGIKRRLECTRAPT